MIEMNTLKYNIMPVGRGIRIECWRPVGNCAMACMRNMRGLRYEVARSYIGAPKSIEIRAHRECDSCMPNALHVVASNICRLCQMNEAKKER